MKWLILASSFIFKNFFSDSPHVQESGFDPIKEAKTFMKDNGKKVLLALTLAYTIGAMFISGLVMTIFALSAQFEQNGTINLTPLATAGFGLMAFALLWGAIFFSSPVDEKIEKTVKHIDVPVAHPLEGAVAMLIRDFIEDRQQRRQERRLISGRRAIEEETARIELRH